MKNAELIARLRLGASISRERKLNQGYDAVADEAADAIEALESQLKNASVSAIAEAAEVDRMKAEVERLTLERDVNKRMRDQHFAEVESQKQMVIKLQSLLDANISLNEWLQAQLAAAQGQEPSVPEGWKLVPVEATPEMISAGAVHHYGACSRQDRSDADKAWDAMLAAAPQPKETK